MKRHMIAASAACLTVFGTPSHAEQHEILILLTGYFPTITYLDPGDTIKFTNQTGKVVRVRNYDQGNYMTPAIWSNGTYTMSVSSFLAKNNNDMKFRAVALSNYGDYNYYTYTTSNSYPGSISYDEAPNG